MYSYIQRILFKCPLGHLGTVTAAVTMNTTDEVTALADLMRDVD